MKPLEKTHSTIFRCTQRDRLWAAFLKAGKDWQLMQAKMSKELRRKGIVVPDVAKIKEIKKRIDRAHRLFSEHIDKHGCWQAQAIPPARSKN